jgi:hypothetical protein
MSPNFYYTITGSLIEIQKSSPPGGTQPPHPLLKTGADTLLSPVTSKPASRGRIKTGHSKVFYSYQIS